MHPRSLSYSEEEGEPRAFKVTNIGAERSAAATTVDEDDDEEHDTDNDEDDDEEDDTDNEEDNADDDADDVVFVVESTCR